MVLVGQHFEMGALSFGKGGQIICLIHNELKGGKKSILSLYILPQSLERIRVVEGMSHFFNHIPLTILKISNKYVVGDQKGPPPKIPSTHLPPLPPLDRQAMILTQQTRFANKAENREVCIFDSPRIAFYTLFLLLSYDTKECRHLTT